ncbi:MAG: hypothetical protein U0575_13105 [Phycisphaerales bacterium]
MTAAQATLERTLPELRDARKTVAQGLTSLQRRLSRAGGVEATILAEEVERQQRLVAQASFLSAWTSYYLGWLAGRADLVREADSTFIELLDTGTTNPAPGDVSSDLRAVESFARTILGVALCRALQQRSSNAIEWLALLEHPATFAALRDELPAWRLSVLLDAGEWDRAREELARIAASPSAALPWLRLAAARGLEAASQSAGSSSVSSASAARRLASSAVAALASRGELAQVLDLARRFGIEGLGEPGRDGGFVIDYVRGVERFDAARAAHGNETPLTPSSEHAKASALYEESARQLQAALREPDAASYAPAAAAAQAMLGWCRYYQGRMVDASNAFAEAASRQEGNDAAESLWMAIVSLDRLRGAGATTDVDARLRSQLDGLVGRFLAEHPSSPRAPHLVLRRARGAEQPTMDLAEQLLSVPSNSDAHADAQRQAVQVLYELFRAAKGAERDALARRLLATTAPMLDAEGGRLAEMDSAGREAHLLRVRQTLEAALEPGVDRHELARTRLDELAQAGAAGWVDLAPIAPELAFRRLQVHLASGETADAERVARGLVAQAPDATWRRAVERAMFRDALERWRSAGQAGLDDATRLSPVVEWGSRVLSEAEANPDAKGRRAELQSPAMLATLAAVAEAGARWWATTHDAATGQRAAERLETLLEIRPTDATALRLGAQVAQGLGQPAKALDRLRTLLAGTPVGSPEWYEAKCRQLAILRDTDIARARQVMDQLKAMHPDYGPSPWAERLRELDAKIPLAPAPEQPEAGTGAGGAPTSAVPMRPKGAPSRDAGSAPAAAPTGSTAEVRR